MKRFFAILLCCFMLASCGNKAKNEEVVDLTALSSTMVYAEVYKMTTTPEDYLGRTIKVSGNYYSEYYEELDTHYHFVVVADASDCCAQGLEFMLNSGDYPEIDTKITIVGKWDNYEESGYTYHYISADEIEVV